MGVSLCFSPQKNNAKTGRHLESLVHDANLERVRGGPPHRYRELFRQLKAAVAIEE